ncbi:MAG: hypothetical protein JO149_03230 [Gammaproteobacteria bacterium]|nr:hypothetical protein [Gammaproteobacteria bacterium]
MESQFIIYKFQKIYDQLFKYNNNENLKNAIVDAMKIHAKLEENQARVEFFSNLTSAGTLSPSAGKKLLTALQDLYIESNNADESEKGQLYRKQLFQYMKDCIQHISPYIYGADLELIQKAIAITIKMQDYSYTATLLDIYPNKLALFNAIDLSNLGGNKEDNLLNFYDSQKSHANTSEKTSLEFKMHFPFFQNSLKEIEQLFKYTNNNDLSKIIVDTMKLHAKWEEIQSAATDQQFNVITFQLDNIDRCLKEKIKNQDIVKTKALMEKLEDEATRVAATDSISDGQVIRKIEDKLRSMICFTNTTQKASIDNMINKAQNFEIAANEFLTKLRTIAESMRNKKGPLTGISKAKVTVEGLENYRFKDSKELQDYFNNIYKSDMSLDKKLKICVSILSQICKGISERKRHNGLFKMFLGAENDGSKWLINSESYDHITSLLGEFTANIGTKNIPGFKIKLEDYVGTVANMEKYSSDDDHKRSNSSSDSDIRYMRNK